MRECDNGREAIIGNDDDRMVNLWKNAVRKRRCRQSSWSQGVGVNTARSLPCSPAVLHHAMLTDNKRHGSGQRGSQSRLRLAISSETQYEHHGEHETILQSSALGVLLGNLQYGPCTFMSTLRIAFCKCSWRCWSGPIVIRIRETAGHFMPNLSLV